MPQSLTPIKAALPAYLLGFACLAAATAGIPEAHAEIRITEVMYDGVVSGDADEWIALFNEGAQTVDLSTYAIGDEETPAGGEMMVHFPAGALAPAGTLFLVVRDGVTFDSAWGASLPADLVVYAQRNAAPEHIPMGASPANWGADNGLNLSNSGDEIILIRQTGPGPDWQVVDGVSWASGATKVTGGVTFIDASVPDVSAGSSIARLNARIDTDSAADWAADDAPNPSGAPGGTPCGDGVDSGLGGGGPIAEACDDGNVDDGDGCDATCAIECGWVCDGFGPGSCETTCGDGNAVGAEACDDGNAIEGDGCGADCRVEAGYVCESLQCSPGGAPSTCRVDPCTQPLRIYEVHLDGATEPDSEWIAVLNAGDLTFDLSAWTVGDEETQHGTNEGTLRFPPGATIAAGQIVLVANDPATLLAEFGATADYAYGQMVPEPLWATGTNLTLANSGDEVVLTCGGVLKDQLIWGSPASQTTLAPPTPAWDGTSGHAQSFLRADPWIDSGRASDWWRSDCPTPENNAGSEGAPSYPELSHVWVQAAPSVPVEVLLPITRPGVPAPTITVTADADSAQGILEILDPATGTVRFTPDAGASGAQSIYWQVSDGCRLSPPYTLTVHVSDAAAPLCDPNASSLRLTEVHADALHQGRGEWFELHNPSGGPISLAGLRVIDSEDGAVVFPSGAWVAAGDTLVIAADAAEMNAQWAAEGAAIADWEWRGDRDGDTLMDLPRVAGADALNLALVGGSNGAGVLSLVGCNDDAISTLQWPAGALLHDDYRPDPTKGAAGIPGALGVASSITVFDGPTDPTSPDDSGVTGCPTPGVALPTDQRPRAGDLAFALAVDGTVSATLPGQDPDGDDAALTWEIIEGPATGVLARSDPDGPAFVYLAAPGAVGIMGFSYRVSDGCGPSKVHRVSLCVGTTEVPGNTIDDDCDGVLVCYVDADGDGWGSSALVDDDGDGVCDGSGEASVTGDCDDDPTPSQCGDACHPQASEICDGRDNDCDATTPDGAEDPALGDACDSEDDADACRDEALVCTGGDLVCPNDSDGDDLRVEVCDADNIDEDCDGGADDDDPEGTPANALTYYRDADDDGAGDPDTTFEACDPPGGWVDVANDCDDDPSACGGACRVGVVESLGQDNCADGYDNDCDGLPADTDEPCFVPLSCYADADGDGFGDPVTTTTLVGPAAAAGCASWDDGVHAVGHWVSNAQDCDDDPAGCGSDCAPGEDELCDGFDNDCDPATVDGSVEADFGDACDAAGDDDLCGDDAMGCVAGAMDCVNNLLGDEQRAEVCDAQDRDEDCDGGADDDDPEGTPDGATPWYVDVDGDGAGDAGAPTVAACDAPDGYSPRGDDCDDDPQVCGAQCSPMTVEALAQGNCADTFNNDCDGDGADQDGACFGNILCYADVDQDGAGDFTTERLVRGVDAAGGCAAFDDGDHPEGYWVANGLDCDDDPAGCGAGCAPGEPELCDGLDNDCEPATVDGSGDVLVSAPCDAAEDADQCSDDISRCQAGAVVCENVAAGDGMRVEVCDAGDTDEDCDGGADDADPDGLPANVYTWYLDADNDGIGRDDAPIQACEQPAGRVLFGGDCDDDPQGCGAACAPGYQEICDGQDNDCDPATADGSGDLSVGAPCDSDQDGDLCEDEVATCEDGLMRCHNDPTGDVNQVEVCDANDTDEDCDGGADDADGDGAPSNAGVYYRDRDGDGFGEDAASALWCDPPAGWVAAGGDCNDDPVQCGSNCRPDLTEDSATGNCTDGYDNDCDGVLQDLDPECVDDVTCFSDSDGDGHGNPDNSVVLTLEDAREGCRFYTDGTRLPGYWVTIGDDCNDGRVDVFPGRPEVIGDGIDQDCSGADLCWFDADGDGYATDLSPTYEATLGQSCDESADLTGRRGDCDDRPQGSSDVAVCGAECSPGLKEVCVDGFDNDCDGGVDEASECSPDRRLEDDPVSLYGGSGCSGGNNSPNPAGVTLLALLLLMMMMAALTRRRFKSP